MNIQPIGTPVPASAISPIVLTATGIHFGLAGVLVGGDIYPVVSSDGGTTWRIDGPVFYIPGAHAPGVVTSMGALGPNGAYAWGMDGNFVRVTADGGQKWWVSGFYYVVQKVTASNGAIDVSCYGGLTYESTDLGRTFHLVQISEQLTS